MSIARVSFLVLAAALILASPAAAQRPERISADLLKALREVDVQKQLIASGSLDAVVGRASRAQLRTAIEWFRKAYQFKAGLGPLTKEEREKLQEVYAKFEKATGLEEHAHADPDSKVPLRLRLPLALVKGAHAAEGGKGGSKWTEYRADDNSVSIGPVVHPLSKFTPISLFRERVMSEPLKYKHLHLTSDEFTALGEVGGEDGYVSYNLVLSYADQLKGLMMRYAKRAPEGFNVPDFLVPMVEAEVPSEDTGTASETTKADARSRGWQLLLASIANLVASDFPFDNGWESVSTKECPLSNGDGGEPNIRVLFGTDRRLKPGAPRAGRVTDPDALFAAEGSGGLSLGCAYVSQSAAKTEKWADLVSDYKLVRESKKKGDIGDQIYLADELVETGMARADALVFIHGYNVPFKYALSTVGRVVAETGYKGRVYMYSWPSTQSTLGYVQDLDNAEQAEPFFQSFMRMLMRDANIYEIDVLAHSMGSQTMLRAVSALRPIFETQRGEGKWARPIRIGQMIFAAPDVAMSVFDQKIHRVAPYAKRVTVYASSTDTALLASKVLRGGVPRVGDLLDGEPILIDVGNVHIIDATGNERWYRLDRVFTGYGHDYFSQDPAVLADIKEILMSPRGDDTKTPDQRAKDRFEVKHYKTAPELTYWKLKAK